MTCTVRRVDQMTFQVSHKANPHYPKAFRFSIVAVRWDRNAAAEARNVLAKVYGIKRNNVHFDVKEGD